MDDKKKLNENTAENGDYREEMDELVRIFKEELDKATAEAEKEEEREILLESQEFEVEGYDPKAVSLDDSGRPEVNFEENCECCGERPRGTKKNPDGPFCEECEALLEKYPYDWKGLLAVVLMIGITIFALVRFAVDVPAFSYMMEGDKAYKENRLYTAMTNYDSAEICLEESTRESYKKLFAKRAVAEYKLLNMSLAWEDCETYLDKSILKLPGFGEAERIYDEIYLMQASATVIQNHLYQFDADQYDEIIAELDSLSGKKIYVKGNTYHDETEEEFTPDGSETVYICDESWINLYKYSAAQYCGKEDKTIIGYLEAARGKTEYVDRLVSTLLAATYIGTGDYEKAEPLVAEIKAMNAEGIDYHLLTSMLYRYRDKNYQRGVDICVEGLNMLARLEDAYDLIGQVGYILSMQKTLNLVMLGDYTGAYESAEECCTYQMDSIGTVDSQSRDLWAILALATNNTEKYDEFATEIEEAGESGIPFSSDVADYKEGKITLEEIVMSGRYDLL